MNDGFDLAGKVALVTGSSVMVTALPIATSRVPSGFSEASNGGGGGRLGASPGVACGKISDLAA